MQRISLDNEEVANTPEGVVPTFDSSNTARGETISVDLDETSVELLPITIADDELSTQQPPVISLDSETTNSTPLQPSDLINQINISGEFGPEDITVEKLEQIKVHFDDNTFRTLLEVAKRNLALKIRDLFKD